VTSPTPGKDLELTNGNYRDGRGRFVGSEQARKRRQEAVKLRLTGMAYARIAEAVGYADEATAYNAVKMELAKARREGTEELREIELQRYDAYTEVAVGVLRANHVMVSITRGQVIIDQESLEPVKDFGPVLAALDRLLHISKLRTELTGIKAAPPATQVNITVTEVSQADLEFREMVNEERAKRAAARAAATASDDDSVTAQ
jgi:hypothetical protein